MFKNITKKIISLPLVLCLTVLCFASNVSTATVFAATNEVSIQEVDSICTDAAGGYTRYFVKLNIKVKNIAYEKKVTVHYKDEPSNVWKDVPATYCYSLGDGYEVWTVDCPETSTFYGLFEYCLKYEVAGQTYWDNNNGRNYMTDCTSRTNF